MAAAAAAGGEGEGEPRGWIIPYKSYRNLLIKHIKKQGWSWRQRPVAQSHVGEDWWYYPPHVGKDRTAQTRATAANVDVCYTTRAVVIFDQPGHEMQ